MQLKWHVPSPAEKEFTRELLRTFLTPQLTKVSDYVKGDGSTMTRWVVVSLFLIYFFSLYFFTVVIITMFLITLFHRLWTGLPGAMTFVRMLGVSGGKNIYDLGNSMISWDSENFFKKTSTALLLGYVATIWWRCQIIQLAIHILGQIKAIVRYTRVVSQLDHSNLRPPPQLHVPLCGQPSVPYRNIMDWPADLLAGVVAVTFTRSLS